MKNETPIQAETKIEKALDAASRDLIEARIAIRFLMSQVEKLAHNYMDSGPNDSEVDEWLAKNDAMNCGRRALGEESHLKKLASTTSDSIQKAESIVPQDPERSPEWSASRN